MKFDILDSAEAIANTVNEIGFLPFFANEIKGFSIEEHCPAELWFSDVCDGPWEWKGPVIRSGCLYGKFFRNKAGFVSKEWFADFANYRRDGYDFDSRMDEGIANRKDAELYTAIAGQGKILSKRLKEICNYRKGGNTGFETVITRLQMCAYVDICDFVYMTDKSGKTYGWGVAEYSTPEHRFGYDAVTAAYKRDPSESFERIVRHLQSVFPEASETAIRKAMSIRPV